MISPALEINLVASRKIGFNANAMLERNFEIVRGE